MKISKWKNSILLPIHYHNKLIEIGCHKLSTKLAKAQHTTKSRDQIREIYIHKEDEFQTIKRNFQNIQKISFNHIFRVRIYQEKTENNEAQLQFSKIPTSQTEFNP